MAEVLGQRERSGVPTGGDALEIAEVIVVNSTTKCMPKLARNQNATVAQRLHSLCNVGADSIDFATWTIIQIKKCKSAYGYFLLPTHNQIVTSSALLYLLQSKS